MKVIDVLIIDDNIDDAELCHRALKKYGSENSCEFKLRHAMTGTAGIEAIRNDNPDCVLLDYSLPGIDGSRVLNAIKKENPSTPIIILTGQGNEKLAVELLKSGAEDYIVKSDISAVDPKSSLAISILSLLKAAKANESKRNDQEITILVVDDNIDDRELISRTLKKISSNTYRVLEASSGSQAMELLENEPPDCVLLDYSLPGKTGLDILEEMLSIQPLLSIILFSGQGNEMIATQAIKRGAFHYLVKSDINPDVLESTIHQAVERYRLEMTIQDKNREIEQYQRSIADRQSRFDQAVRTAKIALWDYDVANDEFYVDAIYDELFDHNIDFNKLRLEDCRRAVHSDDIQDLQQLWDDLISGTIENYQYAYRVNTRSGSYQWISETAYAEDHFERAGNLKISGVFQEVTEAKAEEYLLAELYRISSRPDISLSEKLNTVLKLGVNHYGLTQGIVSMIDGKDYFVEYCYPDENLKPGTRLDYEKTYCAYTFNNPGVKDWYSVSDSDIYTHPCYQEHKLEAYIGTTIFVNNKPFGTINFTDSNRRSKPFTERDRAFLIVLAQWVSNEISVNQSQSKIKDSQQFLSLVMDNIPDFVFVKDEDFNIVQANPSFLSLYPESVRDSVIGTTTIEDYDEEEAEAFLEQDKIAFEAGYSEIEETINFPNGDMRTLITKKTSFNDSQGNKYVIGIGRDITARKEAEKVKEQLLMSLAESNSMNRTIMNSANHLIVATDPDGLVTFFNSAAERALDYKATEVIGQLNPIAWHVVDEVVVRAAELSRELKRNVESDFEVLVLKAREGDSETREWTCLRKDGSCFPIQMTATCLKDTNEDITGYLCIIEDISDRKKSEEQLLRSNQELERFAYVASHDLQEPLRMVVNFTQLLERKYGGKLDDTAKQYIEFASTSAARMQQLVRDLLAYARLGNEAESFDAVDLEKIKGAIHDNLSSAIMQSDAIINWATMPEVLADPVAITSVFQNLIGNAIKYRKKDIPPVITIDVESRESSWLFSIADNGIGMKQEYCNKIFEPFKRLHRKEEYPGTGMGLSICRKTIEGYGGQIWAKSKVGEGSTFYFVLPKMQRSEE